jgi:hypothetical protein
MRRFFAARRFFLPRFLLPRPGFFPLAITFSTSYVRTGPAPMHIRAFYNAFSSSQINFQILG